ncbi:MAG: hypothetical protein ABI600_17350 [Luteolibacter sp.]
MKSADLEPQFQGILRALFKDVPFMSLASLKADAKLPNGKGARADWLGELRAGDETWTLIAEAKRNGQPREVRSAALQVKDYLSRLPDTKPGCGLVLAPFISEQSAQICKEAGIGYADLAGNAFLSFGKVFVERRVAGNAGSVKREAKSIFSPKATRVIRVLLQGPLRAWKVKELAKAAEVSLGHVSAVRQKLLGREWAVENEDGLRLSQPDALLDAWAAEDDFSKRTQIREYSTLAADYTLAGNLIAFCGSHNSLSDKDPLFTLNFAAWLRAPHNVPTIVSAYLDRFPDEDELLPFLQARPVSRGAGNLRIIVPSDFKALTIDKQKVIKFPDFSLVSDLQLFLDLHGGEPNGPEQARVLRDLEDFNGGWS